MTEQEAQEILDSFTIYTDGNGIPHVDRTNGIVIELTRRAGLKSSMPNEQCIELLLQYIMEHGDPREWDASHLPCSGCGKEMAPAAVSELERDRLLRLYGGMALNNVVSDALDRLRTRCASEDMKPTECILRYGDPAAWPEPS